jgi:hypothetical protein
VKYVISCLILASTLILNASYAHAAWLIYHKPEFRGKVIDAATKEPIEGAVVVVIYSKYTAGIAGRDVSVIKAKETLTDKNGEFYFPSYTTIIGPLSGDDHASFLIYKPGYGRPIYSPYGITPVYEEIFFSKGIGTTGDLDLGPNFDMVRITFGIVELPKLTTREERLKAFPITPAHIGSKELPLLYKAINDERRSLGLKGEIK